MWKKWALVLICLSFVLLFVSCPHYEVDQVEEYKEFYQKMSKSTSPIFDVFPSPENEQCIEDMYLFYSERDLLDTYYTGYLKCKYDSEEYYREEKRIKDLYTDEVLLDKNSDSFEYESLIYDDILSRDDDGVSYLRYEYVLFIESEYRIVYVTFFDKELNGKSVNIPEKYLPKELVDLRNSYKDVP